MTFNWRKPLAFATMKMMKPHIPKELELLRSTESKAPAEINELQNHRLEELLLHAWRNTGYYREVLETCGAVRDGKVNLDKFEDIPLLTRDIMRKEEERLKARELKGGRKAFRNTSGGSTGQPAVFWQDNYYWDLNIANKLYHFEMLGKELGEPEMKIWGSPEDIFKGTIGIPAKIKNFFYNRNLQQCFHLPESHVCNIVDKINTFKPKIIWSYIDGIYVVSNYINKHGLKPHRPAGIFAGASRLYPHVVEAIEKAFNAPVINFYGSREVGDAACQCGQQCGMHISSLFNKIEVVDEQQRPVIEEDGEIVVTALMNYGMPLIRYRIGDRGRLTARQCPCGRGYPLLESVSGRIIEVFVNSKGDLVDSYFFIHLLSVVYSFSWLYKFQVIQEDYDRIRLNIVLEKGTLPKRIQHHLDEVTQKIRLVMGEDCSVIYDFVDEIPLTKSGKQLYTIRNKPEKLPSEC